MGFGADLLSH